MQLPVELREKIETILASDDRKTLSIAATNVSLKYRRESNADLQIASLQEAKAYLAARFPATWCSVSKVLEKLLEVDPDFAPMTCLDVGAGPGTATSAIKNIWPSVKTTLLEPNSYLRKIGQDLDATSQWKNDPLQKFSFDQKYDLIISSYVLNEIDTDIKSILDKIWTATEKTFVLIEPGTPQGYTTILKARDYFLKAKAAIAAPCPHSLECPLRNSPNWCHFSVRVDRSRIHLQTKADSVVSYEDEKFSYLIVTKRPTRKIKFRALGNPHGQKVVRLETCQKNGSFNILETSKRFGNYKLIKKMNWGDALFENLDMNEQRPNTD